MDDMVHCPSGTGMDNVEVIAEWVEKGWVIQDEGHAEYEKGRWLKKGNGLKGGLRAS